MEIISDGLTDLAVQNNISENYDRPIRLHTWSSDTRVDGRSNSIVIDLDLSSYSGGSESVSVLNQNSGELRRLVRDLSRWVPHYLENGGNVIVLLSDRTSIGGWDPTSSFGWLDNLRSLGVHRHEPRQKYSIISDFDGISEYFNFVDHVEFDILLNEKVVSSPEVLAIHSLDYETAAVAVNEYADPNGVRRVAPGNLVVLPRPTHPSRGLFSLFDSLLKIGHHRFIERESSVDNRFTPQELEKLVDRGENEHTEFKEEFPESAQKIAKEAVALANNEGGIILFGVEDSGNVKGLEVPNKTRERVSGIIRDKVDPLMDIQTEVHSIEDAEILIVRIPQAKDAPFSKDGTFYIRDETTVRKLTSDELMRRFG